MFKLDINGTVRRFSSAVPLLATLYREGIVTINAFDSPIDDTIWQINAVNGGEVTVTVV